MHTYGEQLLAISQELGDKGRINDALWQLGESLSQSGDRRAGRMYLEQALEMARQENFPNLIAAALGSLARIAFQEGDNPVPVRPHAFFYGQSEAKGRRQRSF